MRSLGVILFLMLIPALCPAVEAAPDGPEAAQNETTPGAAAPLPLLIRHVEGDLDSGQKSQLTKVLEDKLFHFPGLAVYTQRELSNQLGWERRNGSLDCQLPEDCLDQLKNKLGIRHEVFLSLATRGDGQMNLRLRLIVGEEDRDFVEAIPEISLAPVVIQSMIPDLIGLPDELGFRQGVIRISSFPMGAEVHLGDRWIGRTPLCIVGEDGDQMQLTAERPGHPSVSESMKVAKGQVLQWKADLVTRQGGLLVDSNPAGATVLLDGKRMGTTPVVLRHILVGVHEVVLQMPPYAEATYNAEVKVDEVARVRHGFTSEHGTLIVNCENCQGESIVEIYLNGAKVAEGTYKADLPVGRYTVELVRSDFRTFTKEVDLQSGQALIVSPALERGLSLRPGQVIAQEPDYRPGGFTLVFGCILTAFGAYLEIEAQNHYGFADDPQTADPDKERGIGRDSRIAGGVLMGVGAAGAVAGIVLLLIPPQREIAVTPEIELGQEKVSLNLSMSF